MGELVFVHLNVKDIFLGIILGIVLVVGNILGLFSLALPPVLNLLSINTALIVIVILAPILEELFFGSLIPAILDTFFSGFITDILYSIFFAIFHLLVYAAISPEQLISGEKTIKDILIVGGAFLSAFLFSLILRNLARKRNNLIVSMIPHAIINLWLIRGILVIIG